MFPRTSRILNFSFAGALILCAASCNQNWGPASDRNLTSEEQRQRDEKTRENVANATERMKPAIQDAGRKLGHATEVAAEEARAAAQGLKEGWARNGRPAVELNSATESNLMELPGIGHHEAQKIIKGRPYRKTHDLVTRGILSEADYTKMRDQVIIK